MALTDNQKAHYTDVVDVWDPPGRAGLTTKTGSKQMLDQKYAAAPALTDVKCMFLSAKEDNRFNPPTGRSEQDQLDTLDQIFFVAGAQVFDQSLIKLKTAGHPNFGQFFVVLGAGRERMGRHSASGGSNYKAVYCKRANKPVEIP